MKVGGYGAVVSSIGKRDLLLDGEANRPKKLLALGATAGLALEVQDPRVGI